MGKGLCRNNIVEDVTQMGVVITLERTVPSSGWSNLALKPHML